MGGNVILKESRDLFFPHWQNSGVPCLHVTCERLAGCSCRSCLSATIGVQSQRGQHEHAPYIACIKSHTGTCFCTAGTPCRSICKVGGPEAVKETKRMTKLNMSGKNIIIPQTRIHWPDTLVVHANCQNCFKIYVQQFLLSLLIYIP